MTYIFLIFTAISLLFGAYEIGRMREMAKWKKHFKNALDIADSWKKIIFEMDIEKIKKIQEEKLK